MEEKPPPICEKCHARRLDPITDKHHRWCKKCRRAEFDRLRNATPDERRIRRVVPYGDYHAWLALYRAISTGEPGLVRWKTCHKLRFDYTATQKKMRHRLLAEGRLLPCPRLI